MFKFFKKKFITVRKSSNVVITLEPSGDEVTYGNVIGFFKFRDIVYYRAKGAAGRTLDEKSLSFIDSLLEYYPNEFSDMSFKEIGEVLVQPLQFVK